MQNDQFAIANIDFLQPFAGTNLPEEEEQRKRQTKRRRKKERNKKSKGKREREKMTFQKRESFFITEISLEFRGL